MKKNLFPLLLLVLVMAACSGSRHSVAKPSFGFTGAESVPKPKDDGLSFETALVIIETSERKGVDAEYAWIKQHYNHFKVNNQALSVHDKKPFDVITITCNDGKSLPLYFDISNYFGKF